MLTSVCGLTELHRGEVAAQLVANAGCYSSAALLALDLVRGPGLPVVASDNPPESAAGQALQSMDILLGLPSGEGLLS